MFASPLLQPLTLLLVMDIGVLIKNDIRVCLSLIGVFS
jgi:hypothetical protein